MLVKNLCYFYSSFYACHILSSTCHNLWAPLLSKHVARRKKDVVVLQGYEEYEEYREYEHSRNSTLLIIEEISRADAGIFTCTADNGVGVPARHSIPVEVQCKWSHLLHSENSFIISHWQLFLSTICEFCPCFEKGLLFILTNKLKFTFEWNNIYLSHILMLISTFSFDCISAFVCCIFFSHSYCHRQISLCPHHPGTRRYWHRMHLHCKPWRWSGMEAQ